MVGELGNDEGVVGVVSQVVHVEMVGEIRAIGEDGDESSDDGWFVDIASSGLEPVEIAVEAEQE